MLLNSQKKGFSQKVFVHKAHNNTFEHVTVFVYT